MTIVDTATVSALLVILAVAVLASVITLGIAVRVYAASRPALPVRRQPRLQQALLAH